MKVSHLENTTGFHSSLYRCVFLDFFFLLMKGLSKNQLVYAMSCCQDFKSSSQWCCVFLVRWLSLITGLQRRLVRLQTSCIARVAIEVVHCLYFLLRHCQYYGLWFSGAYRYSWKCKSPNEKRVNKTRTVSISDKCSRKKLSIITNLSIIMTLTLAPTTMKQRWSAL